MGLIIAFIAIIAIIANGKNVLRNQTASKLFVKNIFKKRTKYRIKIHPGAMPVLGLRFPSDCPKSVLRPAYQLQPTVNIIYGSQLYVVYNVFLLGGISFHILLIFARPYARNYGPM